LLGFCHLEQFGDARGGGFHRGKHVGVAREHRVLVILHRRIKDEAGLAKLKRGGHGFVGQQIEFSLLVQISDGAERHGHRATKSEYGDGGCDFQAKTERAGHGGGVFLTD